MRGLHHTVRPHLSTNRATHIRPGKVAHRYLRRASTSLRGTNGRPSDPLTSSWTDWIGSFEDFWLLFMCLTGVRDALPRPSVAPLDGRDRLLVHLSFPFHRLLETRRPSTTNNERGTRELFTAASHANIIVREKLQIPHRRADSRIVPRTTRLARHHTSARGTQRSRSKDKEKIRGNEQGSLFFIFFFINLLQRSEGETERSLETKDGRTPKIFKTRQGHTAQFAGENGHECGKRAQVLSVNTIIDIARLLGHSREIQRQQFDDDGVGKERLVPRAKDGSKGCYRRRSLTHGKHRGWNNDPIYSSLGMGGGGREFALLSLDKSNHKNDSNNENPTRSPPSPSVEERATPTYIDDITIVLRSPIQQQQRPQKTTDLAVDPLTCRDISAEMSGRSVSCLSVVCLRRSASCSSFSLRVRSEMAPDDIVAVASSTENWD